METMKEKLERQKKEAQEQGYAQQGGGDFYKPAEGKNRIRVITELETVYKDFHEGICYTDCGFKECSPKYMAHIIDMDEKDIDNNPDPKIKLYEMPMAVGDAIVNLQIDEDYGFSSLPMPYDIKVMKEKTGTKTTDVKYSVLPCPPSEIPASLNEEISKLKPLTEIIRAMKNKNMEKHGITPPDKEAEIASLEAIAETEAPQDDYPEYEGEPTI